ncbi:MAG: GxxExxY protein [Kiritimatiellae bacterium]|nr:GxxExxY protein [Kiritimatiellia bacterium]
MELVLEDETYAIRGAIYEVYKNLGSGFLEAVYQEALEMELASRGISFKAQAEIEIKYKGKLLKQSYRADLLCYDKIILELKAVKTLLPEHEAQLQNYLRATGMKVGLLVNFCHYPGVAINRIVI